MAKAKSSFWRGFSIGLFSSITSGIIVSVAVTKYMEAQMQMLRAQVETLQRR